MRPAIHFNSHRTASNMPLQARRRILLAGAAPRDYAVKSWDVPGACIQAPKALIYRSRWRNQPGPMVPSQPPAKFAPSAGPVPGPQMPMPCGASGTTCGYATGDGKWFCLNRQCFWIQTPAEIARIEADNDDFLVAVHISACLVALAVPLKKHWKINI